MNNAQRARMLARVVVALLKRLDVREIRIPLAELDSQPDFGFVVENGCLLVVLGDERRR